MTSEEKQKISEYINSFSNPAEVDFLSNGQIKEWEKSLKKYESSKTFVQSIIEKDDFEDLLQKATLEGRIFAPSQMAVMESQIKAIQDKGGARVDITESLVSKGGQRVIMSLRLQDILGFVTDSYMTKDEADQLISALQADGVPGPEIDRVNAAMNKFGAIVLQRGIFIDLQNLLEEAIGHALSVKDVKDFVPRPSPQFGTGGKEPKSLEELPIAFIEYLKNNDKQYDLLENDISKDPKFIEFFNNLKQHYTHYNNLSTEKMVGEVVVRPTLWSKLSPKVQELLITVVDRNRGPFQNIVQNIAKQSKVEQLYELKKTLGK